jgi:hypothetical protein
MSDVTSHRVEHLANLAIVPILTIYCVHGTIPYRLLSASEVLSYHLHLVVLSIPIIKSDEFLPDEIKTNLSSVRTWSEGDNV